MRHDRRDDPRGRQRDTRMNGDQEADLTAALDETLDRYPAIDPPSRRQIERAIDVVRDVLGGDVVGAYLYGSAVVGGLRPHSDLDLVVVSARPTTATQKRALIDRLMAISGSGGSAAGSRSIELTVVVQPDVRPWHYPPAFDFQYGDWLRDEFQRGELAPWPATNPDVAILVTMLRQAGEPLFGPAAIEVLDPVPRGDVVRAMLDSVEDLFGEIDTDTRNVVLTLVRRWTTVATGDIRSKDAAADWALARLPEEHRPVLARARAIYLGEHDEHWDDLADRVRPHADHVVREVRRATG